MGTVREPVVGLWRPHVIRPDAGGFTRCLV